MHMLFRIGCLMACLRITYSTPIFVTTKDSLTSTNIWDIDLQIVNSGEAYCAFRHDAGLRAGMLMKYGTAQSWAGVPGGGTFSTSEAGGRELALTHC